MRKAEQVEKCLFKVAFFSVLISLFKRDYKPKQMRPLFFSSCFRYFTTLSSVRHSLLRLALEGQ